MKALLNSGMSAGLLLSSLSFGAPGPSYFSYEGSLYDPSGRPSSQAVSFIVKIYNPAATCILRQEQTATIDLSQTGGYFSISVGQNTALTGDPGLTFAQI